MANKSSIRGDRSLKNKYTDLHRSYLCPGCCGVQFIWIDGMGWRYLHGAALVHCRSSCVPADRLFSVAKCRPKKRPAALLLDAGLLIVTSMRLLPNVVCWLQHSIRDTPVVHYTSFSFPSTTDPSPMKTIAIHFTDGRLELWFFRIVLFPDWPHKLGMGILLRCPR